MRWPWSRRKLPPLPQPVEDSADEAGSADAVDRAKVALAKAARDSETMRRVTGAIYQERQRDNFSGAIYKSMRRRDNGGMA